MPPIRADGIAVYPYRKLPTRGRSPRYQFLQLLRSHTTGEYQQSWQVVYGGVKPKEPTIKAALRELKEETNLTPIRLFQVEFLETFYFKPHDYVLVMPIFAAEIKHNAKITLNDEHTAHRWIPESQLKKHFMWRTQLEALTYLLEQLHTPRPSQPFLEIKLPHNPK
jgi:dATP pyrophosphohydrolase